ncbi:MAG TPA: hypothetical protein VF499_01700 [Afipia sp.]
MVSAVRTTGRLSERMSYPLEAVDYKLAETQVEKEQIYRLRYRAYLREGTIEPNAEQMVHDRYDELPNSWNFGVYRDGVLMSSLRITVSSPETPACPSFSVFPDLLGPEVAKGRVLVDPTRFVADPDREARCPELPYITLRLAYMACEYFEADIGLASVRAEHQAFYRRVFLHKPISEPRDYPSLTKPICLMAVDYPAMRERVFERYPYFRSSFFERRKLFERGQPRVEAATVVTLPQFPFAQATIAPRG